MQYEDFAQQIDVTGTRLMLLDKLFIDIAHCGDLIRSAEDPMVYQRLDKCMGELSMVTFLLMADCITYHSLTDLLSEEATTSQINPERSTILNNMAPLRTYMQEFPLFETIDKYFANELDNVTLQKMVSRSPQLTVSSMRDLSDDMVIQTTEQVKDCLRQSPVELIQVSSLKDTPDRLIENAYEKIGRSPDVPEMLLIRFIANYTSIEVALFNTLLVFKTA